MSAIEGVTAAVRRNRTTAVRMAVAVALALALVPPLASGDWYRGLAGAAVVALAVVLAAVISTTDRDKARYRDLGGGFTPLLAWCVAAMYALAFAYLAVLGGFATAAAAVTLIPVAFVAVRGTGLGATICSVASGATVAVGVWFFGATEAALAAAAAVTATGIAVTLICGTLRRAALDLSALYQTGRALGESLRQEELLPLLLDTAMADLDVDVGMVFLIDRETGTYEPAASRGAPHGYVPSSRDVERSVCDWAVRHRGPYILTKDLDDDPVLKAVGRPLAAAVAVPLAAAGGALGVMLLASERKGSLSPENIEFLEALTAQAATSVDNAILYRQTAYWAIRDGLTGLCNYRHFAERLEIELARATRYQRPVSLLVLDVDLFKRVNDDFGHLVGDEVLRALSARLVTETRETDLVARYGGEEFAVILPETGYEDAVLVAEKLRSTVRDTPLVAAGPDQIKVSVTISIGVATYPSTVPAEHIVSQADEALYDAKIRRDCVCSVRGCLTRV